MNSDNNAICPKCGSRDVKLIAEHQEDPGSFLGSAMPERAIVRVFKCACGMAFTERDDVGGGESAI